MKVLVTAASKHGATAEIASVIAALLEAEHIAVDVLAPEQVDNVAGYDAVVLGSGVYAGHWLKPAKRFVDRHESELRELPRRRNRTSRRRSPLSTPRSTRSTTASSVAGLPPASSAPSRS
jgi:Flavodoxin domain